MSRNVIYCFSGSGNCLDIAKNIARHLGDTDIVMMRSAPELTDARHAERVGFVFPCHAGGLPGNVEEYIRTIAVGRDSYKFAVVSYAGYPGVGLRKIHDIVPLDYWAGISHHCSCIWLMPHYLMMPPLSVSAAQKRAEKLAGRIAEDVRRRVASPGEKPGAFFLNRLESAAWPKMSKRHAEKLNAEDSCIGCGQCEKICPKGNITIVNGKPRFGDNCIQCLSCLQYCPVEAINAGGASRGRERYHNVNVTAQELMKKQMHFD